MAVEKLAFQLLLAANRLTEFFIEHSSRLRLNLFPPCPSPVLAFGVASHKDGGTLTVLAQDDVGGLNVKRKVDGQRDDPTYLVVANARSLASYGIIAVCTHLGVKAFRMHDMMREAAISVSRIDDFSVGCDAPDAGQLCRFRCVSMHDESRAIVESSGYHIMMPNIYAEAGRRVDVGISRIALRDG
ncbi:hypothetical protein ACLOJK_033380 [Asimina triloba]